MWLGLLLGMKHAIEGRPRCRAGHPGHPRSIGRPDQARPSNWAQLGVRAHAYPVAVRRSRSRTGRGDAGGVRGWNHAAVVGSRCTAASDPGAGAL